VTRESAVRTDAGILFHAYEVATENASQYTYNDRDQAYFKQIASTVYSLSRLILSYAMY